MDVNRLTGMLGVLIVLAGCGGDGAEIAPTLPPEGDHAETIAPVPFGQVESITGSGALEVCAGNCQAVRTGASVSVGAGLSTDAVARVSLRLEDGSRLWVDADTRMQVVGPTTIRLESGRMLVETRGRVTVETPAGEVEVSAGAVAVRSERAAEGGSLGGRTRISVVSGQASLRGREGVTPLGAGESAMVEGGEVTIQPSASLAYQTAWARDMRVEAEAEEGDGAPRGVGNIHGKDPRTKAELPEALEIRRLAVHATVHERVARTEIEQVITNRTGQTLEGFYTFPLPHDASIVRFAMEVNGQMMEGELVERGRAVKIFDQIVADYIRPRDPALLEWKGGNTFQMRIFPIFGGKDVRIILWYTQVLPADGVESRYVYPLPRTGKVDIDAFSFTADIDSEQPLRRVQTPMYASSVEQASGSGRARVRFDKEHFSPRQDLVLEWEVPQYARAATWVGRGLEAGESPYFMMVLRPNIPPAAEIPERGGRPHVFIMDTSFGMAEGDLKAEVAAITAYLADLDPDDTFTVLAADQTVRTYSPTLRPVSAESVQEAIAFLEKQRPGGASWVDRMFEEAGRLVHGAGHGRPVIVYVGDGRATLGETRHDALVDAIDAAVGADHPEVHALGIGADVHVGFLERLTRRFGGTTEIINRGEDVPRRVAGMARATRRPSLRQAMLNFSSDNVELVYPTQLPTVRQGEELVVVGRFRGTVDGQVTLTGLVGEEPYAQPFRVALSDASARGDSFVPRVWAQRHIEHLTLFGGPESRDEIVRLSRTHSVMSRYTSFLVLESDRMYREFNVERRQEHQLAAEREARGKGSEEGLSDDEDGDDRGGARMVEKTPVQKPAEEGAGSHVAPPDDGVVLDNLAEAPRNVVPAHEENEGDEEVGGGESRRMGFDAPMGGGRAPRADADPWGATGGGGKLNDTLVETKLGTKGNSSTITGGFATTTPPVTGTTETPKEAKPKVEKPRDVEDKKNRANDNKDVERQRGPMKAQDDLGRDQAATRQPRPPADPPPLAHRDPPYRPHLRASIRSLSPTPAADNTGMVEALTRQIAQEPLSRDHRRRLVRHHLGRGDAEAARVAAEAWVQQDGGSGESHWVLADLLARTGDVEQAEVHFGDAIELAPQDSTALARWARHLSLRDEVGLAAAAHQALFASTNDPDDMLDLVTALARVDTRRARDVLAAGRVRFGAGLDRRQQRRADELASMIDAGGMPSGELRPSGKLDLGGAGAITLSWEGDADLDISVLLPYGERISADMPLSTLASGRRGVLVAESARGHVVGSGAREPLEALVLPFAPQGTYRIEVVRRGAVDTAVEGWVVVRMLGDSRTFRVTIPAGDRDVRVAEVGVTYH